MVPARGDVWLFDLGMQAKVRPGLIVSVPYEETDRALLAIVPHTTSLRGSRYEVVVDAPFRRRGAFVVQSVATYPNVRAVRKLGTLRAADFHRVLSGLLSWLGHG
jgi:mRNA interferase MazF